MNMTKEAVIMLPSQTLRSIVRSTSPAGKYWMEYQYARAELARREAKARKAGQRAARG